MGTKEDTRRVSETVAADPGLNLFGGIAADVFGQNLFVRDGQYVLGSPEEWVKPSNEQIRAYIKDELGADPIGWNDPDDPRNTPELLARRKKQFDETERAMYEQFMADRGRDVTGQVAGDVSAIRDLFHQQNPLADESLGLIRQGAQNQQNLFGLGHDRLAELLGGGGGGFDPIVNRALTDVKESFSTMGGLFSSDAQASGARIASELGANYLLDAINTAGNFGMQQLGFGSGLLDYGSQYERQATPAGRAFTLFQNFANPQSTDFFAKQSDSSEFMNQRMRQSGPGLGEQILGNTLGGGLSYQGEKFGWGT